VDPPRTGRWDVRDAEQMRPVHCWHRCTHDDRLPQPQEEQMSTITMYTTPWCGYCARLKGQLDREGIAYDVVDIEQVPDAASIVEQVNHGNQTVPTLVYADGSAQTNPSLRDVQAKLASLS